MRICVIGAGYVGLVSAACFAEMGNQVTCIERDSKRFQLLSQGRVPIYEPGLESLIAAHLNNGQLRFTQDFAEGISQAQVIFIAVGTPSGEDGSADLCHVLNVAEELGRHIQSRCLIVDKSTVPVGTGERVAQRINRQLAARDKKFQVNVASNPEFLKEGSALDDFMRPDRVIIGCDDGQDTETLRRLYAPFIRNHERLLCMSVRAAEFTKYAANAFLATKISFINEMAGLCTRLGVDIEEVRRGIGSDKRIGTHFIYAGCGYGGSCFPKDVRALIRTAEQEGIEPGILRAVEARNALQKTLLFQALREHFSGFMQGRVIAIWGLSFKPGTDDLREAPSLVLIDALLAAGATVKACDPVATSAVAMRYQMELQAGQLSLTDSPYTAALGADALVLVTEWKQFRQPDFARIRGMMRMPVLFDGRNIYDAKQLAELGFLYRGIGRPQLGSCMVSAA
ncbi:UDP-glucose dehydrogenase family protein [Pseudomonas sp. S9]|uniref:UDP-glucose dehydrogenase family protein n=1 Tax=Pseudomonas sp. S9 TaxID=686578 RepID=UPI0002556D57|nr:UDP-glucose/GDP-mannose dehydrogenase family protein [Pseudomonas sp. S9]